MKKVLITGVTGFAGSFLAEHLVSSQKDIQISGTYISDKSLENVASIKDRLQLIKVDLTDYSSVKKVIEATTPDIVYHLAAIAAVSESLKNPSAVITNNASAELNLLEALRHAALLETKVIIISSAHVYGKVAATDLPIAEATPFIPDSAYAVSKITQDFIGLQYFLAYKMPIIRLRPFNHLGPRLSPEISISYFAREIALMEKGQKEPVLKVGNLEAKRDFTDVRDIVRAYALSTEKCISGEVYNIGSGTAYGIGEILTKLLFLAKVKIDIQTDTSRLRPSDIPELRADASKFMALTGWKPEISIDQTLKDTLEYWRNEV